MLYTNGDFVTLAPAQFSSHSAIRYSQADPAHFVLPGSTVSGTLDFASSQGSVAAETDGWTVRDRISGGSGNDTLFGWAGYGYWQAWSVFVWPGGRKRIGACTVQGHDPFARYYSADGSGTAARQVGVLVCHLKWS